MRALLVPAMLLLALLLGILALWMAHEEWEEYEHRDVLMLSPGPAEGGGGASAPLTLEEVLRRLDLPRGSRILEVEREAWAGRLLYEIEYLTPDGKYRELRVDPRTAEVLARATEERGGRGAP